MISVKHIEVIVPARNEEQHIGQCLTAISAARDRLGRDNRRVSCGVTVVVDCCTDRTAVRAAEFGALTVVGDYGRVGSARRAGAADAVIRSRLSGLPDETVWFANTDADSVVPAAWLTAQLQFADAGEDAVIGTVVPDGLTPDVEHRWRQRHTLAEGHAHVHGANLGVRASTYLAAGGFADVALHEDRDLVERVKTVTRRWVATHRVSVTTSARLDSRVDGGFASYVAGLGGSELQGDATCA
ncbi:glycosyltransferase [Mycobacterium sp. 236(2023)]|uniref:glycosyltransferase n=1 Tax=Mycobacterium sp. 236(2023) TaxID=3038163 RepID=UPI0024153EAD|nr:glycosyltransferase [Mycobacterium sp. 236(2023)]MDG4664849.1 glycosyltransferase [Mycobacterium sp. 236(2023)]